MSVSSAHDEEWSIISSSSDIDDDLLNSCSQLEDEITENTTDAYANDTTSEANGGVTVASADETNQDSSTYTITDKPGTSNSVGSVDSTHWPNLVNFVGNDTWNLDVEEDTVKISAHACSCKDRSFLNNVCALISTAVVRADNAIRFASALCFDLSFGMILAGLRTVRSIFARKAGNQTCYMASHFVSPLSGLIIALEYLSLVREVWLYQLTLATIAILTASKVYQVAVPIRKPAPTNLVRELSGFKSFLELFEALIYEKSPRRFFGFSSSGKKKLRVTTLYHNVADLYPSYYHKLAKDYKEFVVPQMEEMCKEANGLNKKMAQQLYRTLQTEGHKISRLSKTAHFRWQQWANDFEPALLGNMLHQSVLQPANKGFQICGKYAWDYAQQFRAELVPRIRVACSNAMDNYWNYLEEFNRQE